jgi:hypothetical protein
MIHHSPGHHSVDSFLLTIQGSFPCSNKEITLGLVSESPAQRKKREKVKLCISELKSIHNYQAR